MITLEAQRKEGEVPSLQQGDVKVKQGKNLLKVTQVIPARGDNDAIQMFILIGNNLNDLRDFINAQPASAVLGIGYMSKATVNVFQNFTADHALAAKAVRLPSCPLWIVRIYR